MRKENQQITKDGGYIQNVYYTTEMAKIASEMMRANIDHLISSQFQGRMKEQSVIRYIADIEDKIKLANNIANFNVKS